MWWGQDAYSPCRSGTPGSPAAPRWESLAFPWPSPPAAGLWGQALWRRAGVIAQAGSGQWATLAEPQICHLCPHQPPPPALAVASGCSRAQLPSQRHSRELSWEHQPPRNSCLSFLTAGTTCQQCPALSCLTILSWQEAAGCSAPLVLYL